MWMKKFVLQLCAVSLLFAGVVHAQNLASLWQGTFKSDSGDRRAVLQIAKKDVGGWQATAFYIEFMHDDLHVDSLLLSGSDLKVTFNGGKAEYDGKVNGDGASIAGVLTLDQPSMPVELRRATNETAWHTPFQYQYHLKDVTYSRPSPAEGIIPFSPRLA